MLQGKQAESLNVFGETLIECSADPLTGFLRDGCCNTGDSDAGVHTVCCKVTEEFLQYSRAAGNDLSTPRPEFAFPGLKPGDHWCLCAARFLQAHDEGCAPRVNLSATHQRALDIVPLDVLQSHALHSN